MKIKIFLVSALALLSSMSCTKWLNVVPTDTIIEEDLFRVGTGYRNALNGIYKQMSSSSLYGRELSWGMVDVLSQTYDAYSLNRGNAYYALATKYDYESSKTKPYFDGVWSKAYNTIANCNNIIGRITSEPDSKFKSGSEEKNLILGESIALRAFLHLDMLRLFAPAPIAGESGAHIPYYESYPSLGEPNLSVKEVAGKIIRDLKQAQELVAQFDTVDVVHRQWMRTRARFYYAEGSGGDIVMPKDIFFHYRGYRMNYFAVTAILARAYNYMGEHDLAAIEAQKVIDAKSPNSQDNLFEFTPFSEVDGNRKLYHNIIFTLSDPKLYDNYINFYPSDDINSSNRDPLIFNDDYGSLFDDGGDCRLKLLDKYEWDVTSNKNRAPAASTSESIVAQDMLPIVRTSELYLIVAEKYAYDGDFVAAANTMDILRDGRNCEKGRLNFNDTKSFVKNLILEVRREYFGEGQLFYYYKKYNTRPSRMSNVKSFVIPRPESENVN